MIYVAYNPETGTVDAMQPHEARLVTTLPVVPLVLLNVWDDPFVIARRAKVEFERLRAYTVRESNRYHLFRDCWHLTHRGMVYPVSEHTLDQIPKGGRVRGRRRLMCVNCRAHFTELEASARA